MTKEEKKSNEKFFEEAFTGFEREVIDEYAKQKAIEFVKWRDLNFAEFDLGVYFSLLEHNHDKPKRKFNIEQLFDLFNTNKEV